MLDNSNEKVIWKIYIKGNFFAKQIFTAFHIVSATKRRRDTEMLSCVLATLRLEYQFLANLVLIIKIISLNLNLDQAWVRYAEFNCDVNFFCFGPEIPFLEKFGLKIQNCLKWNLVLRLIWICRIHWMHWMHAEYVYSLFSFSSVSPLFG